MDDMLILYDCLLCELANRKLQEQQFMQEQKKPLATRQPIRRR